MLASVDLPLPGNPVMRSTRRSVGSAGVVRRQIGEDLIDILGPDGRAELVDHLVNRLFPTGAAHERRVHRNVIEAVAGHAGCDGEIAPRRIDQMDALLAGERACAGEERTGAERHAPNRASHATSKVSERILLLW